MSWRPPEPHGNALGTISRKSDGPSKTTAGIELPAPARKTIDLEGRIVQDGVRKAVKDRQIALDGLLKAIREFRKYTDEPLTLRGSEYAHAVQELNKAIDRADGLLL